MLSPLKAESLDFFVLKFRPPRLHRSMKDENILVVRRSLLEQLGMFQGLSFEVDRYLPVFLKRENNFFTPRPPAETNPDLKQIIPYVLIMHGDKIFHYVRGKKSGEQRLVAKGSLGIGGHMNDTDEGLFSFDADAYRNAVQREVAEEMFIEAPYTNHIVALLNDDSNEVGKVHLGVVHIFKLAEEKARKRESVITEAGFLPIAELRQRRDALETWSQLCIDGIDHLLEAAK
jgi:predicted NUDIX family phosphoesterase